jgi:hypothetical protein
MRILLFFVVAAVLCPPISSARGAREQERIHYLIESLASLKGAIFIRNGTEYDAAKARAHLQEKLAYAGERVKTAEEFIKYCASQSSISRKPYQIRFADGRIVETATYFSEKLKEFDQKTGAKQE